ncbi:MAG TPA: DinB family protein [Terriglobales bacterium]|nr:DinB family protein [Terriglobales bacterium]
MDSCLQQLHEAITAAMSGLTLEELKRRPPGKWCAAEVLEHLYLSYAGTVKGLGRCLQEGRSLASAGTWSQRTQTMIVTRLGYMPTGRTAPAQATPRGMAAEQVVAEICPMIRRMQTLIDECDARFGRKMILDHPILGPFTADEWRKFHWVHGRHHVKQIWRLRGREVPGTWYSEKRRSF